jgi:hypothetical protein
MMPPHLNDDQMGCDSTGADLFFIRACTVELRGPAGSVCRLAGRPGPLEALCGAPDMLQLRADGEAMP